MRLQEKNSGPPLARPDPEAVGQEKSSSEAIAAPEEELADAECYCPNWATLDRDAENRVVPETNLFQTARERPDVISEDVGLRLFPRRNGGTGTSSESTLSTPSSSSDDRSKKKCPSSLYSAEGEEPEEQDVSNKTPAVSQTNTKKAKKMNRPVWFSDKAASMSVRKISELLERDNLLQSGSWTLHRAYENLNPAAYIWRGNSMSLSLL
eukprot:g14591.t1